MTLVATPARARARNSRTFKAVGTLPRSRSGSLSCRLYQVALPRLGKNAAQVLSLFALSNLWIARKRMLATSR